MGPKKELIYVETTEPLPPYVLNIFTISVMIFFAIWGIIPIIHAYPTIPKMLECCGIFLISLVLGGWRLLYLATDARYIRLLLVAETIILSYLYFECSFLMLKNLLPLPVVMTISAIVFILSMIETHWFLSKMKTEGVFARPQI